MKCISPIYVRKVAMFVPCNKCAFCLKKHIDAWCLRLAHELEVSSSAYFLTLTYNDEHIPKNHTHPDCVASHQDHEVCKRDLQLFIKRLRKQNPGIRYFAIGEYGTEVHRPHYHAVIFNLTDLELVTNAWTDEHGEPIGFIMGSKATMGRIHYMVSYMALPQDVKHLQPPFRLMSRNPGIGNAYVQKWKGFHRARSDSVIYVFDCANAMPRYYKDKIYTNPHQKEMVRYKAMEFSYKHPQEACPVQHARLLKKLNRKHR